MTLARRILERECGGSALQLAPEVVELFEHYHWPGNVRQLINVAERAVLQNRRGTGSIASLLMADTEDARPP